MMNKDELFYIINGAVFEVNRILGAGFLESVYENALSVELRERDLDVKNQVSLNVEYKGMIVGEYRADIIVEDSVIIEVKAIKALLEVHTAQLLNYMKATGIKLGMLVNFTHPKAEIKRYIL
ncbi:MAG: GxxExxY protein [SAR324 cluster bacterium]|nr:GxxExxY protein [SAR324 cluster bacterium]